MANRINYERVMEETIAALERDGQRPQLLLHACCAPCSSATLERLADHFDVTILYYNPNIAPPEEYHRRKPNWNVLCAMPGTLPAASRWWSCRMTRRSFTLQ